jgi:hypothetical protein
MTRLEELIKNLPPDLHSEAEDFLEFLLAKRARKPQGPLKLDWRGALRDFRERYTSVELQHKAQEWWGD